MNLVKLTIIENAVCIALCLIGAIVCLSWF